MDTTRCGLPLSNATRKKLNYQTHLQSAVSFYFFRKTCLLQVFTIIKSTRKLQWIFYGFSHLKS